MQLEKCSNCEAIIGKLETAYIHNGAVVCGACDKKLKSSAIAEHQKDQQPHKIISDGPKKEKAGEQILCSVNPVWLRSRPITAVILLLFFPLSLPIYIFWFIQSKCTSLIISDKRSTLRQGIFSKFTTEVRHKDIRNILIEQSFFERIFNVGTIGISSAGQADVEIVAKGIPSPQKKVEMLRQFQD
ncbi:MAG: PH domain-containing protein [Planctomycetes bacterium]|nr:PH domain-containing protein [Planctomycetota bacterium]